MKKSTGMTKVKCECGDEILLVPDVKEMDKAIEDHVDLHLQGMKGHSCSEAEAEHLRVDLITQVLIIASQSEEKN